MAGAMTLDGGIVRIDRPMPWVGRLLSLPLLAASGYLLWNVALGLRQDFFGFGRLADDLVPVLVFTGFGLLVGIPGIILLTFRYFVVLNETLRQIVITRQFGPLNIRSSRNLADYHFISVIDDYDTDLRTYDVNLCATRASSRSHFRASRVERRRISSQARSAASSSCRRAIMSAPSRTRTD
ncbi:hypothetical protein ABIA00_001227 [Bradyrhizobium ottawaense]|uniref:hypothetical protein n=1 Tax=Bradyrhizobium ottawaense TaxID=931866 RepID=UPI001FE55CB6|nr:hypothetical protein [Bradyrhizobium ottawaense]